MERVLQFTHWFYTTNNCIGSSQEWLLTQKVTNVLFTSSSPILILSMVVVTKSHHY